MDDLPFHILYQTMLTVSAEMISHQKIFLAKREEKDGFDLRDRESASR